MQAIESSRISIIIFSRSYASKIWCLEELEKIMECRRTMGQVVVPVFYGVDPSEVRNQTGEFGESFESCIKGTSTKKEKVLRTALHDAASLLGFAIDSRNENEDANKVVMHALRLLHKNLLSIPAHLVGIESRVQDVIKLLNNQQSKDPVLLGIWGMVGAGKTTIAKAICNLIGDKFECWSFIANVREFWEQNNGGVQLQEKLLYDMYEETERPILNIESGKFILKERLGRKRLLLVLDDVTNMEQLHALCESHEWFGPGSIIIITTRDRRLLNLHGVNHIYRMTEMDESESLKLFSCYAFKQEYPVKYFVELSRRVVAYSGGLPLALVVLGSHLYSSSPEIWKSALARWERVPPREIYRILKVSFDGLDDNERQIFLDIACFLVGMDINDVVQALKGPGYFAESVISVLEDLSLVTIDEKNKLRMHVLLQDMGREIVREKPGPKHEPMIFDVFLSFRGEDARATFISHLYTSLGNAGIYAFKDDNEIQKGDKVSISLLQAIGRSKISVIVLSRNYANSRWCLQELENIMVRRTEGLVVVPVFYGVDPSEVRNQTGLFGQAFEDLIKRISLTEDKKLQWKDALLEVGGIAGFVVLDSRNESEDIKKIVEHVTLLLDRTDMFISNHPVGVESRVNEVIKVLNNQQSGDPPLLLGICGMGGIGKTTIAKAIYNQLGRKFEGRSFLLDVSKVWEQDNGGVRLQEQLLCNIYKTMKVNIDNIESGKSILEDKLGGKRVLLVLDDVDKLEQLNALCGSHKWFSSNSVIIITTRDDHLLSLCMADHVLRVKEMDERESMELFSWHAFKHPSPGDEFIGLSSDVIAYSGGLPLALEVLGSHLFRRGIEKWKCALKELKSIPNDQVQKKLKISFDGLNGDTEKEIFLDIAFFLIGMDQYDVIHILDDCGYPAELGISVLVERSLVTIDNKNKLRMHDLLRDMGREIIRQKSPKAPEERSRLWNPKEVLDILSKDMGTKAIEGLALKLPGTNSSCLKTKAFENMKRLRLLQFAGVQLHGNFKYLSTDLRLLCWYGFPLTFIPANLVQGNLVAIDLKYSNLEVWKKGQLLEKLKILNLSHSHYLKQTPNFSYLPNLEKLILKDCPSLLSVSPTIEHLKEVLLINLEGCTSLRELPRSIYKLKSLKTLILSGCLMIDKLEEDLEQMESLTTLKADNTAITQVPNSLVSLKSIGYVYLCGFEGLSRHVMPSIIWSFTSPTKNLLSRMQTSTMMSSLVSFIDPNSSFYGLSSIFAKLPKVQRLRLECRSELEITADVAFDSLNATNCKELEATPTTSQVSNMKTSSSIDCCSNVNIPGSKNSLNSFLIQMGMNCSITNILRESISQKLTTSVSEDCLLPDDKNPDWLTFSGEGSSITFEVPQVNGRDLKTMTLCIVYSSLPESVTSEGLKNVLIINFTKATTHVFERDTLTTLENVDWQSVISNLEPGNKVQILVFGNGSNVKKTAVYLIYDEPINGKKDHCQATREKVVDSGSDDIVAENNVIVSGEDMAEDKDFIVPDDYDIPTDENVKVCGGEDMPEEKNIIVSGSYENRFRRPFTFASLLMSLPFWFGLATFLWWTRRRSRKQRR